MSERFQVDCRGVPASVEVVGRGPVVVMVGAAVPMAWVRPSCVELGYTVLNFDYEPPDGWDREPEPRSALDQTEDVVAVMAATGLAMAHVVGLSRGAITAYGFAAMHSELVETLTLVCPVAGFEDTLYNVDPTPVEDDGADRMTAFLENVFSREFLGANLEMAKALVRAPI